MTTQTMLRVYEQIDLLIKKLYYCTTKETIEGVFNEFSINNLRERVELLRKCMKVENVFNTPQNDLDEQDEYDYELSIFIEGSWRLLA